jgi:hypothetical protein
MQKNGAVEWLIEELGEYFPHEIGGIHLMVKKAKELENQRLIDLVEQLKNYTKEAKCILGDDEREASEFVEIFKQQEK